MRAAIGVNEDQNMATLEDANRVQNPEKNCDNGAGSLDKNRDKTTAQTLPAWLNCAKGSIARDEPIDTGGIAGGASFALVLLSCSGGGRPAQEGESAMRLSNKVALITGAGSGIGRATALLFAREGARVVVADLRAEAGRRTVEEIEARGGEATFVQADVSRASDAEAMVRAATAAYGRLDILHNNAGILGQEAPAHELSEELWDRIIGTNLKGMWLGCKYAIPELIEAGGGAIFNTASMSGVRGRAYRVAYCASKGASSC